MTSKDKIIRDMETLKESIRLDYLELTKLDLTPEDRRNIRDHIQSCVEFLRDLYAKLERKD